LISTVAIEIKEERRKTSDFRTALFILPSKRLQHHLHPNQIQTTRQYSYSSTPTHDQQFLSRLRFPPTIKMRTITKESALVGFVSSLLLANQSSTAFIPNTSRRQTSLSHFKLKSDNIAEENRREQQSTRSSSRLFAVDPSSSMHNNNNRNNDKKRTTALNAATGISLSSPSIQESPRAPDAQASSGNSGLGVLFLNLGGPTTGDDVEGKGF